MPSLYRSLSGSQSRPQKPRLHYRRLTAFASLSSAVSDGIETARKEMRLRRKALSVIAGSGRGSSPRCKRFPVRGGKKPKDFHEVSHALALVTDSNSDKITFRVSQWFRIEARSAANGSLIVKERTAESGPLWGCLRANRWAAIRGLAPTHHSVGYGSADRPSG
jgi:hypothetical protein